MNKTFTLSLLFVAGTLLSAAGATSAYAQSTNPDLGVGNIRIVQGPTVRVITSMNFGSLQRLSSRSIEYLDADAALFAVDAEPGRTLDLNVRVEDMVKPLEDNEDGLGRGKIRLEIRQEHCAYSLDKGETWQQFSSSLHTQRITIPSIGDAAGSFQVLVRVGGSIEIDHNQRKGEYLGRITVEVEYQ